MENAPRHKGRSRWRFRPNVFARYSLDLKAATGRPTKTTGAHITTFMFVNTHFGSPDVVLWKRLSTNLVSGKPTRQQE